MRLKKILQIHELKYETYQSPSFGLSFIEKLPQKDYHFILKYNTWMIDLHSSSRFFCYLHWRYKLLNYQTFQELDQFIYCPHISSYVFFDLHWERKVINEKFHEILITLVHTFLMLPHTVIFGRNQLLIRAWFCLLRIGT